MSGMRPGGYHQPRASEARGCHSLGRREMARVSLPPTRFAGLKPSEARRASVGGSLIRAGNSHVHLQRGNKCLLRDVDLAELAHALLAFLLLVQKFALARHVAAITLCRHVLAERTHGFARDDLAADRGLDRHLEHVWRDQ